MWILCAALSFYAPVAFSSETPQQKVDQSETKKVELKGLFSTMTQEEQTVTGVTKLSSSEQEALIKWWTNQKNHPRLQISKEVTLSAIQDDGKYIVLSDGTRLSLTKSFRKKVSKWAVGDKIGIGELGRRGTLTIYHMATGRKIKAHREQAPEKANDKSSEKPKS